MPRALTDWLAGYLDFTKDHESPEKIHLWTGFTILSAALRRQIYMDRGFYKLYPNLFVLIVAESAKLRKSVAMDIGISLLKTAVPDVFIMQGRMTPEGLVKNLNRATVITVSRATKIRQDSHVLIHADELATLFGYDRASASRMAVLLTELYASKDYYPHTTSKEGVVDIYNSYPTLLSATDPHNLKVLPEDAVAGLIGRLVIITAARRRKPVAWPEPSEESKLIREKLIEDLKQISSLHGVIVPTPDARKFFTNWYEKQSEVSLGDPRSDAFHERCHDTALKLAMLISLSRNDSLIVDVEHMAGGVAIIEKQLPEISRILSWAGSTTHSQYRARFIDLLRRNKGVNTRKVMIRAMGISIVDFDAIESALLQEGSIDRRTLSGEIYYQLIDDTA